MLLNYLLISCIAIVFIFFYIKSVSDMNKYNKDIISRYTNLYNSMYFRCFVNSTSHKYSFDPFKAKIVKDFIATPRVNTETGEIIEVSITRYCQNEYGEYFMLIFEESMHKPFIKHTPKNIAKVVLKKDYIE